MSEYLVIFENDGDAGEPVPPSAAVATTLVDIPAA
jgi:hypothetical protein